MRRFFQYLAVAVALCAILAVLAFLLYTGFGRYTPPGPLLGRQTSVPLEASEASAVVPESDEASAQDMVPEVVVAPVQADPIEEVTVPAAAEALVDEPGADVAAVFSGMPSRPDPAIELIDRRAHKRDWSGAMALCRQILDNDPKRNEVRLRLAGILVAQGKMNDGYREASVVLADNPEDARANFFMGEVILRQGLPSLALTYARKAVSIEPEFVEARRLLARSLAAEGSFKEAREVLVALVNVVPNDLDVLLGLAGAYEELGDAAQAIQILDKAAEMQPASPVIHLVRGHHFLKCGQVDDAIASYRKVLEITPANVVALNNVASLLAEREGQAEEAMRLARMAWQLAPGSPEVADTLGWLYYREGDYRQAMALLVMAVRKRPQEPQVRYHFAAALAANDRLADAENHLDAALKMAPDFKGADAARALLEKIRNNELTTE